MVAMAAVTSDTLTPSLHVEREREREREGVQSI